MKIPQDLIPNKSLSALSTLGIGGPARFYAEIKTIDRMQEMLAFCAREQLPFFILGKGSNCLFDDRGFNGCVLHNKIDFMKHQEGLFHVGAGYSFSRLGTQTAKLGYGGLEFASGIPASVGGAVFMNAGANGGETKDFLISVDFVDETGTLSSIPKHELDFSYRSSTFQKLKGAIVGATFQLTECSQARKKQCDIIHYRQKTQPYKEQSAGCVFRNPSALTAGKLIETCGLKGLNVGDAEVSLLHGNFLINKQKASAEEFKSLIQTVQKTVWEKTGISLECEIRRIAYDL